MPSWTLPSPSGRSARPGQMSTRSVARRHSHGGPWERVLSWAKRIRFAGGRSEGPSASPRQEGEGGRKGRIVLVLCSSPWSSPSPLPSSPRGRRSARRRRFPRGPSRWKTSRSTPTPTASPTAGTTSETPRSSTGACPARRRSASGSRTTSRAARPAPAGPSASTADRSRPIIVGLWVRQESIVAGERLGDEPSVLIDFLGDPLQLKTVRRGVLGPWKTVGPTWTRVSKRLPIPSRYPAGDPLPRPDRRHRRHRGRQPDHRPRARRRQADLEPDRQRRFRAGRPQTRPPGRSTTARRRVSPGYRSASAIELKANGARAFSGLGLPVQLARAGSNSRSSPRRTGSRGASSARAAVFFLDDDGRPLIGFEGGVPCPQLRRLVPLAAEHRQRRRPPRRHPGPPPVRERFGLRDPLDRRRPGHDQRRPSSGPPTTSRPGPPTGSRSPPRRRLLEGSALDASKPPRRPGGQARVRDRQGRPT